MLQVENITVGYSDLPVLKGVSINVAKGEFVSIVGPNGAGKTTLFKTISGILTPMSGSITFEGVDLLSIPPARRPHLGIAHIPEGRQVFPSLTVMDNLEMGAYTEAGRRRLDAQSRSHFDLASGSRRAAKSTRGHAVRR